MNQQMDEYLFLKKQLSMWALNYDVQRDFFMTNEPNIALKYPKGKMFRIIKSEIKNKNYWKKNLSVFLQKR